MTTQEKLRAHIRAYLHAERISMSELSRRLGRREKYVNNCVTKHQLNIGHERVLILHQEVNFPADLLAKSKRDTERRWREKYERIAAANRGQSRELCGQPWPVTVRKLTANKPAYNFPVPA